MLSESGNVPSEIISAASTKTNRPRPDTEIAGRYGNGCSNAIKNADLTVDDIEWTGVGTGIANNKTGVIEYSNNLGF